MIISNLIFLFLFSSWVRPLIGAPLKAGLKQKKLLYIMIDGFRYDYVDMQPSIDLPGFSKFLRNGVRADWMTPVFPSISYPDFTTLVTGLWPESHGVVGNYIYDSENYDKFLPNDEESAGNKKWWTAEPIWISSTKAGLKTGVVRWSRCEVPFDNILPEHCEPNMNIPEPESFVNNTKKALNLLENGFDFVLLYTSYTDTVGHYKGPETEEMVEAVKIVDDQIKYILEELSRAELEDRVNIIIVSDHGMKNVYPGAAKHIELDEYLNLDLIEVIVDSGAYSNIKTTPGSIKQVYDELKQVEGIDVYKKDEVPHRLHFSDHKYVHDIVIIAKEGYFIQGSRSDKQLPLRITNETNPDSKELIASHGFDPLDEKMRAIFFAKGPDFKENDRIPAIQNVDVYPLLAHLLNVELLPNNGTMLHVQESLRNYL